MTKRKVPTTLLLELEHMERAEKLAKKENVALAVILRRWIALGRETEEEKAA